MCFICLVFFLLDIQYVLRKDSWYYSLYVIIHSDSGSSSITRSSDNEGNELHDWKKNANKSEPVNIKSTY